MVAPQIVRELVERFERNREQYTSSGYNETQVRREFLDPLFTALGWDVDNKAGYGESYKDVIHEDAIKIGGTTKVPDYSFRIGGIRKFFVEAKKPSIDINSDPVPAWQLRRYAWSSKLFISVLSNFAELSVYDGRFKPDGSHSAAIGRIFRFKFDEYEARWDELASFLSKDAILKGNLERLELEKKGKKKGTASVDDAFLEEMETWRKTLAENIARRNPALTQRELNSSVQRIIDRIVFLRICEDRGIEREYRLGAVSNGHGVYARLCDLFVQADLRYNSGLFHFRKEKGRTEEPDDLTLRLTIDDKPLKEIIKNLYYPDSPYEFSVFPADILGQVYERFLGKVIRLTTGHQARVEEKPEVKKAGGVYYTPTHIVDYIVRHTLEPLVAGKTPKQLATMKILDPACGSGSFLLGAYQYLLDWHLHWYVASGPDKHRKEIHLGAAGEYRLTSSERKRILLNNIHGVDIDPQAVEVTKLSLLLRVLEGESGETINQQLKLLHERALPDLGENIKCGNSLIGPDFGQKHLPSLTDDEAFRVNAFDWWAEFPHVMASKKPGQGGFDAIIGNPPYIRIQTLKEWAPLEVEYYKATYETARKGSYDIYVVFVERGLDLLKKTGRLGYILPSKFFTTDYGQRLRERIAREKAVDRIVSFGHAQVFANATTYTALLFLDRSGSEQFEFGETTQPTKVADVVLDGRSSKILKSEGWSFEGVETKAAFKKALTGTVGLLDFGADIARGSSTGSDPVFILTKTGSTLQASNGLAVQIEEALLRIPIYAGSFQRYRFEDPPSERVVFPYRVHADGYEIIPEIELKRDFPAAFDYLSRNKKVLQSRKQSGPWYGFSAPRSLNVHDNAQLGVPLLANQGLFAPMPHIPARFCVMASAGFSVTLAPDEWKYCMGILNSRLAFRLLQSMSSPFRGGYVTCTKQYVGKLPIRIVKSGTPQAKLRDRVVEEVERLLDLSSRLVAASGHEHTMIARRIASSDQQLDRLVYELYGLSTEEISALEGTMIE